MKRIILAALWLVPFVSDSQECVVLYPEVRTMGFADRDLGSEEEKTLPIVFHIMHTGQAIGEGANITDEQIIETLSEANKMFRKEPGSVGDGEGADTKIDFCLAQRDPDGNPTTGVTRHDLSDIPVYVESQ